MIDVAGKDRYPLGAADLLRQERGRQAVDPLLGALVEDLDDLVGMDDVLGMVLAQGPLSAVDREAEVETAGSQQGLLGQVVHVDGATVGLEWGGRFGGHSAPLCDGVMGEVMDGLDRA